MCLGDMTVWERQVLLDSPYMLLLASGSFMINVECIWFAYFVCLWKDFAFFLSILYSSFPSLPMLYDLNGFIFMQPALFTFSGYHL